jgi:hypothetical protein
MAIVSVPISDCAALEISRLLKVRPGPGKDAIIEMRLGRNRVSFTAHGQKRGQDCYRELRIYQKTGRKTLIGTNEKASAASPRLAGRVLSLAATAIETEPRDPNWRQHLHMKARTALAQERGHSL